MKSNHKVSAQRILQISLGLLWLLDGALQLQRQMFTSSFASQVIAPAAQGQPHFVSGPMNFGIHMFLLHPAIFNALIAAIQLGLGVLILWKRSTRFGLIFSAFWGIFVWIFGEGYGGIFSAHTSLLMGAPGAVIIYVLLAIAIMPRQNNSKVPKKSPIAYWLALVWFVIWLGGGIYQLLPGQNSTADVSSMVSANASGAPGWLASLDIHVANVVRGVGTSKTYTQTAASMDMTPQQMAQMPTSTPTSTQYDPGYLFILLLAALNIGIGIGVLRGGLVRKAAIGAGIILSLVFWVVGQSLGAYYTGLATDPSNGPLFVLLGVAILSCSDLDQKLSRLGHRIEYAMVGKPSSHKQSPIIEPLA